MNTKLHTCHPYLSPAQLPKQASLDVKTDGEGREKDRREKDRVKPCFFIFFSPPAFILSDLSTS